MMTSTLANQSVENLELELLRLREEVREIRADRAVRRLFLRPADEAFSPEEFFQDTGVRFRGDLFVAMEFEDDPKFPPAKPREDSPASFRERFARLKSLVLSVLGEVHPAVLCNQNGGLCCVLNWQGEEMNWHSACAELVRRLNDVMWERLGFRFQCVVGRMHYGVAELRQAQKELEQAKYFRKLLGVSHGEILFYDGILQTKGARTEGERPSLAEEDGNRQLYLAVKAGDGARAKEIFSELVERSFVNGQPAVQFIQLRVYAMIDALLKTFERAARSLDIREEVAALHIAPRLLETENVWDLRDAVFKVLEELQDIVAAQQKIARLPSRMRQYIRSHYMDPDLNVNQVASHFGVTPTYATRAFKEQFGAGVLGFIQQVRVEQAKVLLQSGGTVKEVAGKVGYRDPATLIRLFKRLEGITPARFGKSAGEQKGA